MSADTTRPVGPPVGDGFSRSWSTTILERPPLIAPARSFVYPQRVPGEEDALERGALQVLVQPAQGGTFLALAALGFRDASLPSGVFTCPAPDDMLLVAGGYAYLVNTLAPETCVHLPLRPVTAILAAPASRLLLLAGFHHILAVSVEGVAWQSERLSSEGISLDRVDGGVLHGTGWNMIRDRDVPFTVDLANGQAAR